MNGSVPPFGAGAPQIPLAAIAEEYPELVSELARYDRAYVVSTFGGLLAEITLQSNCFRLEALVHLAVCFCRGRAIPPASFFRKLFERIGSGLCGQMEDPPEDVFATIAHNAAGNFKVLEGLKEGGGFYLQRLLSIMESMPSDEPFGSIKGSANALIALSDVVLERAGVRPFDIADGAGTLSGEILKNLPHIRQFVRFTRDELENLGIDPHALAPFFYSGSSRKLLKQSPGRTDLERAPLIEQNGAVYFALPTGASAALTRYVVEQMLRYGYASSFNNALVREFEALLSATPLMSKVGRIPMTFQPTEAGHVGSVMAEADHGRYLHVVAWVEGIDDFSETGVYGISSSCFALSEAAADHVEKAIQFAKAKEEFRSGLSVVVGCNVGRGSYFALRRDLPPDWRLTFLPIHDLVTLSWLDDFTPLSFWRILDSEEALRKANVELFNVNGLLNLFAWVHELEGHLVPHGDLPANFVGENGPSIVVVRQNALINLRQKSLLRGHSLRALDTDHRRGEVRKFSNSVFTEDQSTPIYVDEEALLQHRLRAVYISAGRFWWLEIVPPQEAESHEVYEHWEMLIHWLTRSAPKLDEVYPNLPATLELRFDFKRIVGRTSGEPPSVNSASLSQLVTFTVSGEILSFSVNESFDDALALPDNVAENSIILAIVAAVDRCSGGSKGEQELQVISSEICPTKEARWRHRIHAQEFRDYISRRPKNEPIKIDSTDDALLRIGLGTRALKRKAEFVEGVESCCAFLNDAVRIVLDDLCEALRCFNKQVLLREVMGNYEAAAAQRLLWRRTSRANLALHSKKDEVRGVIIQKLQELNAASLASRIVIEAATCECLSEGGDFPGELDLSRLFARAMLAYHYGNWSDAIHYRAISPRLKITPLGDIHIDHSFMEQVFEPFGRIHAEVDVKDSVEGYEQLYGADVTAKAMANLFEKNFLIAWDAEYGLSVDQTRAFVDALEDVGVKKDKLYYESKLSEVLAVLTGIASFNNEIARVVVQRFTLPWRQSWRACDQPFSQRDWYPWRFRRRLSLLRKPIVPITDGDDPTLLVAPALLREAMYLSIRGFHSGEIPGWQVHSEEMRKWLGHANNTHRTKFNQAVADRVKELGWSAEPEMRLTRLLRRSFNRDFGDIDVLAWDVPTGRVLAIECKDLQMHKTVGEVAEQLSDFRGAVRHDGKRDLLRKHLDRIDALREHSATIEKELKLGRAMKLEAFLVFKNYVPMQFAWEEMSHRIKLMLFEDLHQLEINR
jgi:hypothetical protein